MHGDDRVAHVLAQHLPRLRAPVGRGLALRDQFVDQRRTDLAVGPHGTDIDSSGLRQTMMLTLSPAPMM
jgi:hypothetical protein